MDVMQKLRDLAVSESGFVFDPYSGASFNTNSTGFAILQGLKDGLDREALIQSLHEAFETEEADLDRDLDDFIFLLRENGVVDPEFTL
jgi:hypothetical protein